MADYLVQEADGTSKFTLEDGTGAILLEASSSGAASDTAHNTGSAAPFILFLGATV